MQGICAYSRERCRPAIVGADSRLARTCHRAGARIAADTHGPALASIVETGLVWLIAPNVEELCELLGCAVADTLERLVEAGRRLLNKMEMILISRGEKGALIVTKDAPGTAAARPKARCFRL